MGIVPKLSLGSSHSRLRREQIFPPDSSSWNRLSVSDYRDIYKRDAVTRGTRNSHLTGDSFQNRLKRCNQTFFISPFPIASLTRASAMGTIHHSLASCLSFTADRALRSSSSSDSIIVPQGILSKLLSLVRMTHLPLQPS